MKSKGSRMEVTGINDEADELENIDMNEMTDSEDEYSEHERRLLKKVRNRNSSDSYDSDYEVYEVHGGHEDNPEDMEDEVQTESMDSDIERLPKDFDLPNEKAWGKKKKAYYFTDYVDADYATASEKQLAEAEIEEEEARNIQKRLAEQLDDADFGLDIVESAKVYDQEVSESRQQLIKTDLSKLNKRQKQAMMQKESPEFGALVNDFKERMLEVKDVLGPFLKLRNRGMLNSRSVITFVHTKYHLLLNYCINISFYLMLKAKRLPVSSHPVIKRLAQYRQLINQLESEQRHIIQTIHEILGVKGHGNLSDNSKISLSQQKMSCCKKDANYQTNFENVVPNMYLSESESEMNAVSSEFIDRNNLNEKEIKIENVNTVDPAVASESKRAITYQIAKNKGLTPHRKKEQRNPRVKHRNKYRKAKIRRKGAVREVRREVTRYAGEISGIKAGVKKSIKLK